MRTFKYVLQWLVISMLAIQYAAFGQQAEPQQDPANADTEAVVEKTADENSAEEKVVKKSEPESKKKQSPKVFNPTEEISKDLPVPFPIDI